MPYNNKEVIAYYSSEKEILIAEPIYKIKTIETWYLDHKMVKVIEVGLKGIR